MLVSLLNTLEYHQYKVKVKNHPFVYRLDSLCTDFPVHVHCALFCALCICSFVILFLSAVIQEAVNTKMAASHQVGNHQEFRDCSQVTSIWKGDLCRENTYFDVF